MEGLKNHMCQLGTYIQKNKSMLVYYETCNILGVLHDLIQTTPYYASLDCTILITILEGLANMGIF